MTSPSRRWNLFVALLFTFSVITLGGVLQLWSVVHGQLDEGEDEDDLRTVVVAARDLQAGETISLVDLQLVEVPEAMLPSHHDEEAGIDWKVVPFTELDDVVGLRPRLPILEGELIRPERLADGHSGKGLNAIIPARMRAYSVGISGDRALAGLLQPGSTVDILVQQRNERGRVETRPLLQRVPVAAVNARLEGEEKTASRQKSSASVTFLVSPEQVTTLAERSAGSLSLVLRNGLDGKEELLGGMSVDGFRALFAPKPKPLPKPEARQAPARPKTLVKKKVEEGEVIIDEGARERRYVIESDTDAPAGEDP